MIPQLGARPTHNPPNTVIDNVLGEFDPRTFPCIVVCLMEITERKDPKNKYWRYWSESTRRVIAWRLGGLPDEFKQKGYVPVQMTNCENSNKYFEPTTDHTFQWIHNADWKRGGGNPAEEKIPGYLDSFGKDTFLKYWTPTVLYAEEGKKGTAVWEALAYARLVSWVRDHWFAFEKFS